MRLVFRLQVLAGLILSPLPLAAQSPAEPGPPAAGGPSAPIYGPTIENATFGYREAAFAGDAMTWDAQRAKNNSGPVLAIVGGAALIGGLLIGDDAGTAIAVGGLILGLVGLYLWLK